MTDIEQRALIERLRQRTSNSHMLLSNPPKPAPDRDCHTAADMLEAALAFKQEVSEVMTYIKALYPTLPRNFNRFIIPAPKPDPLADAVESVLSGFEGRKHAESYANQIRAALEARGLEIRSKNDD